MTVTRGLCGHRDRGFVCIIRGPHDVHRDGRVRHYYVPAALRPLHVTRGGSDG